MRHSAARRWPARLLQPGPTSPLMLSRLIGQVRAEGDAALLALTERFDGVRLDSLAVSAAEFAAARAQADTGADRRAGARDRQRG